MRWSCRQRLILNSTSSINWLGDFCQVILFLWEPSSSTKHETVATTMVSGLCTVQLSRGLKYNKRHLKYLTLVMHYLH